jgi:hypothetical protein
MTGFFQRLVDRHVEPNTLSLQPRIPSRFESMPNVRHDTGEPIQSIVAPPTNHEVGSDQSTDGSPSPGHTEIDRRDPETTEQTIRPAFNDHQWQNRLRAAEDVLQSLTNRQENVVRLPTDFSNSHPDVDLPSLDSLAFQPSGTIQSHHHHYDLHQEELPSDPVRTPLLTGESFASRIPTHGPVSTGEHEETPSRSIHRSDSPPSFQTPIGSLIVNTARQQQIATRSFPNPQLESEHQSGSDHNRRNTVPSVLDSRIVPSPPPSPAIKERSTAATATPPSPTIATESLRGESKDNRTVHVSIGRIEVRSTSTKSQPQKSIAPSAKPRIMTLDEYAKQRSGVNR